MSKHTPGPWSFTPGGIDLWIKSADDIHVATIPRAWDGDFSPANARLIAAAPDLLEALERVSYTLAVHGHVDEGTDLAAFIRAALSKATPAP